MSKSIFKFVAVLSVILNFQLLSSQSLIAGDIAFIGMNTDTKEGFSFISLTDIPGGEKIFFSDRSIIDIDGYISNIEGTFLFTAPPGGVPIGTIITFTEDTPNIYTITGVSGASVTTIEGIANLVAGDQMYAYQTVTNSKSVVPSDATFIAGITTDYDEACTHTTNRWTKSSCVSDTSECMIPPGLTKGVDCVSMSLSESLSENMRYTGSLKGDAIAVKLLINDPNNWETHNSVVYDISASDYETPLIVSTGSVLSNMEYEQEASVKIYPNPTANILNVSNIKNTNTYYIYNILGSVVYTGNINTNNAINVGELLQGIYFLKLENYAAIKFIKE
jgi:hypothetical protein